MRRAAPALPGPRVLHFVIVVQHPKLYDHLKEHCFLVADERPEYEVRGHIVYADPSHPMTKGDWHFRKALVQSGLATAEQVAFTLPLQMKAGFDQGTDS